MASIDPNMGLRIWDQLNDKFNHSQLVQNFLKIGAHDHSSGKGVQIPSGGLADDAVTGPKIANEAVEAGKLAPNAVLASNLSSDALSAVASSAMPPASVIAYAGATAPSGWLLMNGASLSRTTYAALFAVLGTTFGSASGSTFNLPNGINAFILGASGGHPRGSSGGAETHTLSIGEIPSHNHAIPAVTTNTAPTSPAVKYTVEPIPGSTTVTQSTGGGAAHNNMPPWLALNWIIKT